MKRILIFIIIIGLLVTTAYITFKPAILIKKKTIDAFNPLSKYTSQHKFSDDKDPVTGYGYGETVGVFFKDGSMIVGEFLGKTDDEYIIKWKGEEAIIFAEQVDHIGDPKEALAKKDIISDEEISTCWPYENDVVIRLTNSAVLDAEIAEAQKDKLTLRQHTEGGGYIELDIERPRVEYLIFKPVKNDDSKNIETKLKKAFPKMTFYKTGNFTIVTDSYITWVREYRKALKQTYTNIYLEFFALFKNRKPKMQNFVVVFDNHNDFFGHAVADGVPGWAVSGYFKPKDKVLYLFNFLGEQASELLFEAVVGESGKTIDEIVDEAARKADKSQRIYIEGKAKIIKDKYWKAYAYYKDRAREQTLSTLRHEFTHEIFHNWGLQNIALSKLEIAEDKLAGKKKAELVKELLSPYSHNESFSGKAANSWLAEGIATYCEVDPPGSENYNWLFLYQQMAKKEETYPLEFLTVYKMGSFPGVYSKAMLNMYAQSWAFVNFLMHRYPKEFMKYQNKMAEEMAKGYQDINWLLQTIGKDVRTLEKEFHEYMSTYEELEDPAIRHFEEIHSIFRD